MRRRTQIAAAVLALVLAGCSPVEIVPIDEGRGGASAQTQGTSAQPEEATGDVTGAGKPTGKSVRAQNEDAIRAGLTSELDLMVAPDEKEAAEIAARLDEGTLTSLETYGTDTAELLSHLLARFTYSIESVDVAYETAVAHVMVQNVDLAAALEQASASMTSGEGAKRLEEAYATGEEAKIMRAATEVVYEAIDAAPVVEHTVDLALHRDEDTWVLSDESQEALVSSALGGSVEVPAN